jgi:hypothetical protein
MICSVDDAEALKILIERLEDYRGLSYAELVERLLDRRETEDAPGGSGLTYRLDFQGFWEGEPGGALRVLGSVDDGMVRAFVPLSDSFLVEPPESRGDE